MKLLGNKMLGIVSLLMFTFTLNAQPSGGPYGPVSVTYEIPSAAKTVYYVAPDGDENSAGTELEKPTTIEKAITKVISGDAIIVRGGTYRTGNLVFNQGITIQPFKNEKAVFKGTKVASEWQKLRTKLWVCDWDVFFPSAPQSWWRRTREGMYTPLYKFNDDMVFVNGKFLNVVGWPGEVDENSYYIDYENKQVYIGVDPSDKLVEITAFNVALHRSIENVHGKASDKIGPTIQGLTFTQYAYRAMEFDGYNPEKVSPEAEHGKDIVGTTIENCEISYCSRVAGYFRGDNLTIKNCKISDTSTEGLFILSSNDVLLEKNIITRNNIENITGYFPAAVKIFNQCYRVTCNDNLVIDHPNSNGIWYDVGNIDGVFTNNWVQGVGRNGDDINSDNLWPAQNGFFFEISKGAVCAGNVFVDCDHGVTSLNSCDVEFYNNTFVNAMAVVARDQRSAVGDHLGWHPATGPEVEERDGFIFKNNLFYAGEDFHRSLVLVWQPAFMCERLSNSPIKEMNNNVYVKASTATNTDLIVWSPGQNEKCQIKISALNELTKLYPEYESESKAFIDYTSAVFKSTDLGNYDLIPEFSGADISNTLPTEISKLIQRSKKTGVGAYSLKK
ncbi:MAG: right-handed parallel beta-helix repeat-containing protein [Prolixibacteraceae bacterium]|jgi:hypothetical protein|nr:right-handed parallel beta-helix repeat-containing protein [Prolixibacteraceae bacterium]